MLWLLLSQFKKREKSLSFSTKIKTKKFGIWSPANAMEETLQLRKYNACRGKFVLSFNGKKH